MLIPVFKPTIKRKDMDAVLTCMVSDSLGPGEITDSFVTRVSEYLELPGGIALREYPRALEIALELLDLPEGAKVIISALSPAFYIDVLKRKGYEPLIADVDPSNAAIHPERVAELLPLGPAALVVHYPLGFVPDLEALSQFGLPIIEDISTALGSHTGVKRGGNYGRFVIVGCEPDGIITAGGGALLLAGGKRELTILKNYCEGISSYLFLPDMNAALGTVQAGMLEHFIARRKEIAQLFIRAILQSEHKTLSQTGDAENIFYSFPVHVKSGLRDVSVYVRKKGIQTREAFQDTVIQRLEDGSTKFPVAHGFYLRCILFPLYPALGKKNSELMGKVLATLP
ncbi:MAG TPA: DegT/DnrJ/EryC1/StrS family aminotransferase [Spirochaetia bacterium]|nr:DegT/DnrJ/EryC1/StrS family aminotransferase [Spirochaetia bacterium]